MDDLSKKLIKELPTTERCAYPNWVGERRIDNHKPLIRSIGKAEIRLEGHETYGLFYVGGTHGYKLVVSDTIIRSDDGDFLVNPINLRDQYIKSYSPSL